MLHFIFTHFSFQWGLKMACPILPFSGFPQNHPVRYLGLGVFEWAKETPQTSMTEQSWSDGTIGAALWQPEAALMAGKPGTKMGWTFIWERSCFSAPAIWMGRTSRAGELSPLKWL